MIMVLNNANLFTGDDTIADAAIVIDDGNITAVLDADSPDLPEGEHVDIEGRRLVPGFVDIQVNGGGGILFNDSPTVESIRAIADAHVRYGTTSLLPTLISDDLDVMREAIVAVRDAIRQGVPGIIGIHLEGPFVNPERKGAHDEEKIRLIDDEAIDVLTSLGDEAVTLVTLAPELTGTDRIRQLRDAGVVVFAGHTAASYADCKAAEAAGITGYTHLFNAMTPLGSREPGVVGAAIESTAAFFGIVADGRHVHPSSVKIAVRAKEPGRAVLVTDAMPTVGSNKRWFELGGERIDFENGILRNASGSLAGSHLTMIQAVRNAIEFADIDWREAVRMASEYPADAVGRSDTIGLIKSGCRADIVELTDDFGIARVWRRGELAYIADWSQTRGSEHLVDLKVEDYCD